MSLKKTLGLALVLLVILLLIRTVEFPKDEAKRKAESLLAGASNQELQTITIVKGGKTFTLRNNNPKVGEGGDKAQGSERTDSGEIEGAPGFDYASWQLVDGERVIDRELDAGALGGIIGGLEAIKLENAIPPEEREGDLSVYGLKSPILAVELQGPFGKRKLQFGKRSDYTYQRYFKLEDLDDIYLSSDYPFDQCNREQDDLRSRTRVNPDVTKLKSIKLESSKGNMLLERGSGDSWRILESEILDADPSAVSELLRNLQSLRVKEFVDEQGKSLSDYGLDKPDVTISLAGKESSGDEKTVIRLLVPESDTPQMRMAIGDAPPFFTIEGNTISHYLLSDRELRIKEPFRFEYFDVVKLSLRKFEGGGAENKEILKLEKVDLDWKVNEKDGDAPFISEYLRGLTSIKATDFLAPGEEFEPGVDSLELRVTVASNAPSSEGPGDSNQSKESERTFHISREFQRRSASVWYVREEGKKVGMFISAESLNSISPKIESMIKVEPSVTPSGPG